MCTVSFYIVIILTLHNFSATHFNRQLQLWWCFLYLYVEKFFNVHLSGKSCFSSMSTALSSRVLVVCLQIALNKSTTRRFTVVVVRNVIKIGFKILIMIYCVTFQTYQYLLHLAHTTLKRWSSCLHSG